MKVFLTIVMMVALCMGVLFLLSNFLFMGSLTPTLIFILVTIVVSLLFYLVFLFSEQNEELNERLNKLEKLLAEKKEQE